MPKYNLLLPLGTIRDGWDFSNSTFDVDILTNLVEVEYFSLTKKHDCTIEINFHQKTLDPEPSSLPDDFHSFAAAVYAELDQGPNNQYEKMMTTPNWIKAKNAFTIARDLTTLVNYSPPRQRKGKFSFNPNYELGLNGLFNQQQNIYQANYQNLKIPSPYGFKHVKKKIRLEYKKNFINLKLIYSLGQKSFEIIIKGLANDIDKIKDVLEYNTLDEEDLVKTNLIDP